jgi:hypothetical protein
VAQARLSVRKIRDVLRLKNEAHSSDRQIAKSASFASHPHRCANRFGYARHRSAPDAFDHQKVLPELIENALYP